MLKLNRWQMALAILTLGMLIATTVSTFINAHSPATYRNILAAAETATPAISTVSQEALAYETIVKQWTKGTQPKSAVLADRALFTKELNTKIDLIHGPVSALANPKSLDALTKSDAIIQIQPAGIMPLKLGLTVRSELDPSLVLITAIVSDVFTSSQKNMEIQLRAAIDSRQKNLNTNLYIIYLFLVLLLILLGWLGYSFAARYKSIQASIKSQLNDLTLSRIEGEFIFANLAKFAGLLQGQRDLKTVSKIILSELAPLVDAQHGVFYILNDAGKEVKLQILTSYAYKERNDLPTEWRIGEGLVGQCALEKRNILITDVPSDYIHITSGLGEAKPMNIMVLPIIFEGEVKGVLELASFTPYSPTKQAFLDQLAESIGIVINTIEINMRTEELLKQSQTFTEELQSQQEELRESNQELEEKTQLLEEQKLEIETKNNEVEEAMTTVKEKAEQLEITSKYKSEFLSNMSHELRTPLNSLLILAEHLSTNTKSHLDTEEVEFAKLIHVSGNDLLLLINEILDLSKIESGTVQVDNTSVPFSEVQDQIENTFRHVAKDRGLEFNLEFAKDLPPYIVTDEMRLLQIIKNLLSNAFKFTEKGHISVRVDRAKTGWSTENESLNSAESVIVFSVDDTGIGISPDKQRIIFEAFQQGDGRTARKYGGTGLGLSISREIARLLGGELTLIQSTLQQGSTFAFYVPQNRVKADGSILQSEERLSEAYPPNLVPLSMLGEPVIPQHDLGTVDDRENINGERLLLIIEDDPIFARIILGMAREKGFKGIVATRGAQALELARRHRPDAITLDIHIPDVDGWTILDVLKRDPDLRHIPVDVITVEENPLRALSHGAFQYLTKPVSRAKLAGAIEATSMFLDRPMKNLLLVAANENEDKQITDLLTGADITVTHSRSGKAGLAEMAKTPFDCVVVGKKLQDMTGTEFITAVHKEILTKEIPVVVFSSESISKAERGEYERLGAASVVSGADSYDLLLDQTALFLHQVVSRLPEEKRNLLQHLHQSTKNFDGKKILIVDDDSRNIIALTVTLKHRGLTVIPAENGYIALELLKKEPNIDLVLMDIMMPGMDGYETMREIRKLTQFKDLPIIALTAKAMVGDREKCIEAGASDYLSKPVNIEQLSSLMQVWLSK